MGKVIKKTITFVTPGMPFDGNTLKAKSLGGSETMALIMAREMAALGHRVFHFTNGDSTDQIDGVFYGPLASAAAWIAERPCDVVILQRAVESFMSPKPHASKIRIAWHHDVAIHRLLGRMVAGGWNTTEHWLLSEYHRKQFQEIYQMPEQAFWLTRNALDTKDIRSAPRAVKREEKLLVFAARPERGLWTLVHEIMPRIWERDPDVRLAVAGYENPVEHLAAFYDECYRTITNDPRMTNVGFLSKTDLYALYSRAGAYIYPTEFDEVSCISAMEAQAMGLPFIHTGRSALAETVKPGRGILIEKPDGTGAPPERLNPCMGIKGPEWQDLFAEKTAAFCRGDRDGLTPERIRMKDSMEDFSAKGLARDWDTRINELFAKVNDSPYRLAKSFYYRSDIVPALEVIKRSKKDPDIPPPIQAKLAEMEATIAKNFGLDTEDKVRTLYEKAGEEQPAGDFDMVPRTPRFQYLGPWIEQRIKDGRLPKDLKILDYGCHHLAWAYYLAAALPGVRIYGVDISQAALDQGAEIIAEKGELAKTGPPEILEAHIDAVSRIAWDRGNIMQEADWVPGMKRHLGGDPDLILAMEIAEHVQEPWTLLQRIEDTAAPGGTILVTTPWGPWEEQSFERGLYTHFWEIEDSDIYKMVGNRDGFDADYLNMSNHKRTQDPLGAYVWWWQRKYGKPPIPPIDMDRKLLIQAPRQTVSFCMITKDAEDILLRTMKSIAPMADEIRVVDTGSTDRTKEIAAEFGAIITDGKPPLEKGIQKREPHLPIGTGPAMPSETYGYNGFSQARNQSIKDAIGDWIFWIDSDETLVHADRLYRYLQSNALDAYSIRQVHLTIEPPPGSIKPDLPARLFRNHRGMEFYGVVHEHPELNGVNSGPGFATILGDVDIAHDGYWTEGIRKSRFGRNIDLMLEDRQRYPERRLGQFLMIRDRVQWARFVAQQNGGGPTPGAREQLKIALVEAEDMIEPGNHLEDLMDFYNEANRLLGQGITYQITAEILAPGENLPWQQPREITTDDENVVWKYIQARTSAKRNQLRSPYF